MAMLTLTSELVTKFFCAAEATKGMRMALLRIFSGFQTKTNLPEEFFSKKPVASGGGWGEGVSVVRTDRKAPLKAET